MSEHVAPPQPPETEQDQVNTAVYGMYRELFGVLKAKETYTYSIGRSTFRGERPIITGLVDLSEKLEEPEEPKKLFRATISGDYHPILRFGATLPNTQFSGISFTVEGSDQKCVFYPEARKGSRAWKYPDSKSARWWRSRGTPMSIEEVQGLKKLIIDPVLSQQLPSASQAETTGASSDQDPIESDTNHLEPVV